jgi:cyclophilin family peptidyl-prolyl cis-trans isomerase
MVRKAILGLFLCAACAFAQKEPATAKPGLFAIFHTEFGDFRAELFEKDAPRNVSTFVALAMGVQPWRDADGKVVRKPLYDNTTFFRIMPDRMIQAGSPTGKPSFNCGFTIRDEILPGLRFHAGSLAMANTGAADSGGCQIFITVESVQEWDGKYTIFGKITDGLIVAEKIAHVEVHDEKPVDPPKLISVTIERIGPPPLVKKPKKK